GGEVGGLGGGGGVGSGIVAALRLRHGRGDKRGPQRRAGSPYGDTASADKPASALHQGSEQAVDLVDRARASLDQVRGRYSRQGGKRRLMPARKRQIALPSGSRSRASRQSQSSS